MLHRIVFMLHFKLSYYKNIDLFFDNNNKFKVCGLYVYNTDDGNSIVKIHIYLHKVKVNNFTDLVWKKN